VSRANPGATPRDHGRRYAFYTLIWLAYLVYPALSLFGVQEEPRLAAGVAGLVLFMALYVFAFAARPPSDRRTLWCAAGIEAIGLLAAFYVGAPFLGLAVYATLVLARQRSSRATFLTIAVAVALIVAVGAALRAPSGELLALVLVGVLAPLALRAFLQLVDAMLELHRVQVEASDLLQLAERSLRAGELQEQLADSLTLVVVKADLAGALLERSDVRDAKREVAELEAAARAALDLLRATEDEGPRGLAGALRVAVASLTAAGVACDVDGDLPPLDPASDDALAFAVREAAKNVLRHGAASHCRIRLALDGTDAVVSVADDGCAPAGIEPGEGLRSLEERVQEVGGGVAWRGGAGFTLEARVPAQAGPVR